MLLSLVLGELLYLAHRCRRVLILAPGVVVLAAVAASMLGHGSAAAAE